MKLKDIEKKLMSENSQVSVPDVCDRAKKAPINRLLSPPRRVFEKKLAVQVLCFAFVLLLMAIFTFITMWAIPKSNAKDAVFGCVVVDVDDDTTVTIGLFMRDGDVIVVSSTDGNSYGAASMSQYPTNDVKTAISAYYPANLADKVRFCAVGDDNEEVKRALNLIENALIEIGATDISRVSSQTATMALMDNLSWAEVYVDNNDDIDALVGKYLNKFAEINS